MKVHLGIGLADRPTLRKLQERLREHLDVLAAGQANLAFLKDADRMLDVPLIVEDGLYVAEIAVPIRGEQLPLLPSGRPVRRGANLREDERPIDQKLVDELVASLEASVEAGRELVNLVSQLPAEELPGAVQDLEQRMGVDTKPLRKDISTRREPILVELSGLGAFELTAPPAVRKTVVSESPAALYLRPAGNKTTLDLTGVVMRKPVIHDTPSNEDQAAQPPDLFKEKFTYEFRFTGISREQRAVIVAGWALGLDVGLFARYATSTSTLKAAPAEVDEVLQWSRLVKAVVAAIAATEGHPFRAPPATSSDCDAQKPEY